MNSKSGIFLFMSKINKKIPNWIKILFRLIILTVLVLKLLGFTSILGFFNNFLYLKLFIFISCSLGILYQLINIFFIYKFTNKNTKIPEILPDFIINWLKEFEIICQTPESIKDFKNMYYKEILVYISIMIFIALFFLY